ncbi:hypothetical protein H3Z83_05620 [Tenacibaculum sp. S7007]|uniref:Uncharacterized protein n=1 Tax=Tenacibaculum pelagium TaxID=2759527 RepID=A0A839ANC0_9FLAO|nr:hypothetical protein [Tenacibaculum pelagium]MBA6155996.1 hypothetical protein [Tenacibaculum pelagium]
MDYIYYTIYNFYLKLFKKQGYYDNPFFYCVGVISTIESMIVNSLLSLFLYKKTWYSNQYLIISISVLVFLFALNWSFFDKRENKVLKNIEKKEGKEKKKWRYITGIIMLIAVILFFGTSYIAREYNLGY